MTKTYIKYDDYVSIYKGSFIPNNSFANCAIRASSLIDYFTFNRLNLPLEEDLSSKVILATCEIAELLYSQDTLKKSLYSNDKIIASETVGPHSVTYLNKINHFEKKNMTKEELNKACYQICHEHLATTGLMYRGII